MIKRLATLAGRCADRRGPPVHTGFSHGDAVTGLMGAYAVLAALHRRDHDPDFDGEWIDLALFESLFRLVEWQVIVHDQLGQVPNRSGNQLAVVDLARLNHPVEKRASYAGICW